MTPAHTEILGVQVFNEIAGRCNRFRMKDVANAAEYVAAVVKRNGLQIGRDRHPRFQIHHHHCVAADRHREWI